MRVAIATRSEHKLREIRAILRGERGLELIGLTDLGVPWSEAEDAIEAFDTFEANALAKARYFQPLTGLPTVADDSGLVVDALGGAPGVRSKRYSPRANELTAEELDRANLDHLLEELGDLTLPERKGRYVCVAAICSTEAAPEHVFVGACEGLILGRPRGVGGFGYDPVFLDPATGRTFAELSAADKDARSHRGAAFRDLAEHLRASW